MDPLEISVDFAASSKRVFTTSGNSVFIGGEEITEDLRGVLRDEARYIEGSRLWAILNDAIIQESSDLALIQSANWEHVLSAKQLHHWGHVFRNIIFTLRK